MAIEIPIVADTPDLDLQVELDGSTYTLALQWNERDAGWYLSILTAEEDPIVSGVKVVLDYPLVARFPDARLPPGLLLAVDTSGTQAEPSEIEDLGGRVRLLYFTSDELPL